MTRIRAKGIDVIVYRNELADDRFFGFEILRGPTDFKARADVRTANRQVDRLADVGDRIFACGLPGAG